MTADMPSSRQAPGRDADRWQRLTDTLPPPADPEERADLLWQELAALFAWYDRGATRNRVYYQVLKVAAIVLAAAVTVLAAMQAPPAVTAALAAGVVVLEGVQQVFQFHPNWISYRATAETLRQHAFLYAAEASPYEDRATRRERLAQVMREITAQEGTSWRSTMRHVSSTPTGSS